MRQLSEKGLEELELRTAVKLRHARPLRSVEASWALGVAPRTIYDWAQEGRLEALPGGKPLRITAESVLRLLTPQASGSNASS